MDLTAIPTYHVKTRLQVHPTIIMDFLSSREVALLDGGVDCQSGGCISVLLSVYAPYEHQNMHNG